jgi:hypothetical protein
MLMSTVAYTIIYATGSKRKHGSVRVYFAKFLGSLLFISLLAGIAWWCAEQDDVHRYGITFEVHAHAHVSLHFCMNVFLWVCA